MPVGGTADQVLTKIDGTDYNTHWTTLSGGASLTISDTAPTGKPSGSLWWESDTGNLYVYYNDGDSSQWVLAVPMPNLTAYSKLYIQDTAPSSPDVGSFWWNSATAQLYIRYNDGDSTQWVNANSSMLDVNAVRFDVAQTRTTAEQAQARANTGAAAAITTLSAAQGADILLNSSTYVDGPKVSQGSTGVFLATGSVVYMDTAGASRCTWKLWDGTNIIASGESTSFGASYTNSISFSGIFTNPAGDIRLSAKTNTAGATANLKFNQSGNSKDGTIFVSRIG